MKRTKVLILGAAGRDFHNFNTVFRGDERYEVVGFTATQIPNIEGRVYPPELAGELYPRGIPISHEDELEFHGGGDLAAMPARYVELLGSALRIEPSPANYLADIDEGFYVNAYLRSWAFEAQLHDHLRTRFGSEWFASREAGSLLRELWAEGQRPTADELLQEVAGTAIEMEAVADRVREHLS